ncbi:tetratricopeptide repeat protein [Coraliomargarita parva]|uniref:tetratricopeptide repeat protein n=1 Tax=Coraliomargarita parva TaxID=3014050 RepID=UPI0022B3E4CA|nr:tetratricopeptide repeat protein [Coraliomargarita parva]
MPNATIKRALFILLAATLLLLGACSNPEAEKAKLLAKASDLSAAGQYPEALAILDELSKQYQNDWQIMQQIGQIHAANGDATMAAFALEQAYRMNPEDVELLFQTYKAQEAAGQPVRDSLEALAASQQDVMSPELWRKLGAARASAKQTQPALDAYLKGVDPENASTDPETASAIGQLFLRLGNLPQAENWFQQATDTDDPSALTALFGLLEIHLRQKQWAAAEADIARLDKQFPGAVDASQWSDARAELKRWRQAQETMKTELAKTEAAKKAAADAKAKAKAEAEVAAAKAKAEKTAASSEAVATGTSNTATEGGKAQIIADLEHAEAMANAPAVETVATSDLEDEGKTITYDPSIAIEPADPELGIEVNFDQQTNGATVEYSVNSINDALDPATPARPSVELLPDSGPIQAGSSPDSLEDILTDAETATFEREYSQAISLYWQALGKANTRADIWNKLSQAYVLTGQNKNAETTALEAIRLSPNDVAYTLDYLRVAQRTKDPKTFLSELETAYDRFPQSPEITLSLARAYERINQDSANARIFYSRFIELAPSHPLRTEADSALARLR